MEPSRNEQSDFEQPPRTLSAAFDLCDLASSLVVADEASAIAVLELAARMGGADAALFVWVIPEDDQHFWYRSIAALDHHWGSSTLRRLHAGPCHWLGHAARSSEPFLSHESVLEQDDENAGSRERLGLRRVAWLIPAPSPQNSDALGLLILASDDEQRLEVTRRLLPAYRALALALSDWFQRRGREELFRRAHLTDRDIDLLRRESLGQGSKRIGAALHAEPKTIDCRFHRLNLRLGVANRRDAVRLCKRYGLL